MVYAPFPWQLSLTSQRVGTLRHHSGHRCVSAPVRSESRRDRLSPTCVRHKAPSTEELDRRRLWPSRHRMVAGSQLLYVKLRIRRTSGGERIATALFATPLVNPCGRFRSSELALRD